MPGIAAEGGEPSIPQREYNASVNISGKPSARRETSSQQTMGWIENYRSRHAETASQNQANPETRLNEAARQRWRKLGEELQNDVAEFNTRQPDAAFSAEADDLYRVTNSASGLELTLKADFANSVVRYEFAAVNNNTAGAPEGGILSIRQSPRGAAEFYSADERLTSEETRQVLLQPVLFPPEKAA